MKKTGLLLLTLMLIFQAFSQKEMEKLNRGLIALNKENSVYLNWRLFALEDYSIGFNIYRSTDGITYTKLNTEGITATTDYWDKTADISVDNYYYVVPVENGVEQVKSEICHFAADTPWRQFFTFDLEPVPGKAYTDYNVNHAYVGDFDGDGDYDYLIKRFPVDASWNTILLDCYDNEGNFKWRIDLGPNVETYIATMTSPVLVADFDSDGKAEIIVKTGEQTIFGDGYKIPDTNGDGKTDYNGHKGLGNAANVMAGPEFVSYVDGETGKELDRGNFLSRRDPYKDWGDTYGARMNFMMSAVGYFDGVHPACVFSRGDGASMDVDAWQVVDGKLKQIWYFTARGKTFSPGWWTDFHQVQCIDVDGDGKDEISWGACMLDDDGSVLYTTKYCHGDRFQITDIDPRRPGLEVFICQQYHKDNIGSALYDAKTGKTIKDWYVYADKTVDIGRADAADIDPTSPGLELFDTGQPGLHASDGSEVFPTNRPYPWVSIWWDGDLLRENLIGVGNGGYNPAINKWNYEDNSESRLFSIYSDWGAYSVTQPYGGRVPLVGDVLGDWREEIFLETSDRTQMRIYSSYTPAEARLYTLMQNPAYRTAITAKGYLCSKYTDYFLGAGMDTPPKPNITFPQGAYQAYNPEEGYYNIVSKASNLSIASIDDVSQQTTVELEKSQIWKLEKSGAYYKIYSPEQEAYLSYGSPADGTDLGFSEVNNEFYFEKDLNGYVVVIPAANNAFVLDVPSCSAKVGLAMNFWTRFNNDCQAFSLIPAETLYDCAGVWEGDALYDDCGTCAGGTTGVTACTSSMQGEDFCDAVGVLEAVHLGFIGDGYMNFDNELASSGSWNVLAENEGSYTIGVRYANGAAADRGMTVSVNGSEQTSFTGAVTGGWDIWKTEEISLSLTQGVNKIEFTAITDDGGPNIDLFAFNNNKLEAGSCVQDCSGLFGGNAYLDNCGNCVGGTTGLDACVQIIAEAEDISCSFDGYFDNNDAGIGFSGTGFINGTNEAATTVSFNMYAESETTINFGVQYAHGGALDRTCQVLVNGEERVASFSMPTTDWTDYQSSETSLSLDAGINEITLVALTGDGFANLDYFYIYGDARFASCETTQEIELNEGWNLISTYIKPDDASIESVFSGLDVVMVKTLDEFWLPEIPAELNLLKTISVGEGYLVFMKNAGTLSITGFYVEEKNPEVSMQNGWHLIGVPYQTNTPLSDKFNAENCETVKSFDGLWQPDGTANTIENLEPGKAYFVR